MEDLLLSKNNLVQPYPRRLPYFHVPLVFFSCKCNAQINKNHPGASPRVVFVYLSVALTTEKYKGHMKIGQSPGVWLYKIIFR